jgi:exosortase D (VPLPA-CTERM-specific)
MKAGSFIPDAELQKNSVGLRVFLVLVTLLAGFVFFRSGLLSLWEAWQRPEYSHGYIIPFVAVFIALKRLDSGNNVRPKESFKAAIAFLSVGLVAGLIGNIASVADINSYGMLLAIAGIVLLVLGTGRGIKLWPAWLYLAFMLPLPNFLYWPLSIKLQFLSSQIGVALIKVLGVPVFLEGNIIDLGSYQLQVAEACSGLRYLFPLMSFGFLIATLYRGPAWQKVFLFLATIPITIIMNSARIAVIGFLVDRYGIAQAEGFLHLFEGWVVFAICIAMLFLTAVLLQRLTANPLPLSHVLDLQFDGLQTKAKTIRNIAPQRWLIATALLLVVVAGSSLLIRSQSNIYPERKTFEEFPNEIVGWQGERAFLNFDVQRILGADDYLMSDFKQSSPQPETVNLLISYYRSQTEGSGIHSPEVCIPAGGWEVSRWAKASVVLKVPAMNNLMVNRAIIQKGKESQLVYYWFEQRGRHLTNDYVAKLLTIWDSVFRGRSDGALIRVVTTIEEGGIAAAEERLQRFLNDTAGIFQDYVPP